MSCPNSTPQQKLTRARQIFSDAVAGMSSLTAGERLGLMAAGSALEKAAAVAAGSEVAK